MTITTPDTSADTSPQPAPRRPRRWPRLVGIVAVIALVLVGGVWVALDRLRPHPYSGTVMQAPSSAPSMDGLLLADGTPLDIDAYRGDLVLVYFGYTSCPDVCPTTLTQVASARRQLGDDADRVHLLMVTIDPERDALESLDDYVEAFDPTFDAAGGELADIERVAAQYGIYFAKGEPLGDGYAMDHTATVMGIDPDGHLRIVWAPPLDVDRLAADLDELL
jgi:protein SCO1/2